MKKILQTSLSKLRRDPIGAARRAIYKIFIAPLKYRTNAGYDAARYWGDRFARYGMAMKGVGDEGLSEQDNREMYESAAATFLDLCRREEIDLPTARVLEIGCGNGFYTQLLKEQGVRHYLGVDITDALFPLLTKRFPNFLFIRRDVTAELLEGEFDLVLMIDVIEHIVNEEKLDFAMNNVQCRLAENSRFMVAPVVDQGGRSLFYVRFWTVGDITRRLSECQFDEPRPFRDSRLLIARRTPVPTIKPGLH